MTSTGVGSLKVCSHLTFAFAFASRSPSKFNIASMETQTQMHRMGLNPFLTFYIEVDPNANPKCEHSIRATRLEPSDKLYIRLNNKCFKEDPVYSLCTDLIHFTMSNLLFKVVILFLEYPLYRVFVMM